MNYLSVEEGRLQPGLKLVLTAGNPGPWGEAVKAMLAVKELAWTPVRQQAGEANDALEAWTRHRNAPVLVGEDGVPRTHWLDLLQHLETLQPEPALIPALMSDRMTMVAMLHELVGSRGLGWYRRLLVFQPLMADPALRPGVEALALRYGYSEAELGLAEARCVEVLTLLSEQLRQQAALGREWFLGEALTALDLYWAAFSNMIRPLPPEDCPMEESSRALYQQLPESLSAAADPVLFQHRDRVWREVIGLPMRF